MRAIYETIGRIVVGSVRIRYGSQLRVAGVLGIAALALGLGAYIATRGNAGGDTEEG